MPLDEESGSERSPARGRAGKPVRKKAVRDSERSRAAVLAAAMKEFAESGYGGARIDKVAERAGVNKQLIYYYFGNKDDLYLAVLDSAYSALRSAEAALIWAIETPSGHP